MWNRARESAVRPERRPQAEVEGRLAQGSRRRPSTSLRTNAAAAICAALFALTACRAAPEEPRFPEADRKVAPIVSDAFSTEEVRDRLGEFTRVVELAGVKPGMWVADVGAGEGYYAVRLSQVVGPRGRVLAEDIVPEYRARLAERVQRDKLDNVAVVLGEADDPKLPARSFDRIFLVHM